MSLPERLPGMVPGRPIWNLVVLFFGYISLFYIVIPIAVGWKLRNGTENELLLQLPGISAGGGVLTGLSGVFYGVVLTSTVVVAAAAMPGDGTQPSPAEATMETPITDGGVNTSVASSTPTQTPSPSPSASATKAPTQTPTATAPPPSTPTPESTQTPTPTPTPTPTSTPTPEPTPTPTPEKPGHLVTVVDIVDGDTVEIRYQNGTMDTARLLGVDAPETYGENTPSEFEGVPNTNAGANCLDQWGDDATDHVQTALLGEQVRITFDENEPRRGYYDRLLVYIHVEDTLFNRQLVVQGYARVYSDSEFSKKESFLSLEEDSQQRQTGLWDCRNIQTETPTETQSKGGNVVIETVHADAAGDEYENLDDEYVVLTNTGGEPVDIGGWTLSDEANHEYTIPSGFTLDPGASVRIVTGQGSNSETRLYWGQEAPVWNNNGDTATLRNENGDEVDSYQYD